MPGKKRAMRTHTLPARQRMSANVCLQVCAARLVSRARAICCYSAEFVAMVIGWLVTDKWLGACPWRDKHPPATSYYCNKLRCLGPIA